jgi:hypothetical protein
MSFSPGWLALREPADAAARSVELLEAVRRRLAGVPRPVIHDLGCGTGSMARWLGARLPGSPEWVLYDRDPELLAIASAGGGAITRLGDITQLTAADLAGASLITASALLDLLTREEVERLVAACAGAGCPALLTLSVIGRVELTPADPLDARIAAAFNAHQRRSTGGRRLLGPNAVDVAASAFGRLGATVLIRPSPWRLGPAQAALTAQWLQGWVGAACEQEPDLSPEALDYLRRRLAAGAAGELRAVVHHADLLAY